MTTEAENKIKSEVASMDDGTLLWLEGALRRHAAERGYPPVYLGTEKQTLELVRTERIRRGM
jgi:hypothetical protein